MYDAKFVWLAFGAGVVIGMGLGKGGDEMIQAFAVVVTVGVARYPASSYCQAVVHYINMALLGQGESMGIFCIPKIVFDLFTFVNSQVICFVGPFSSMVPSMPASESIKMRHLKILIVMAVVGVQTSVPVHSQTTTDVSDVVSKALNAYGPVSVTETTYETVTQSVCTRSDNGKQDCQLISTKVPKQTTSQKVLTASNIRVVSNTPVVYAAVQYTSFPSDIKASFTNYFNCVAPGAGVTPDTKMATLTVMYGRTTSSTITTGITHTVTDTVGLNWSNTASAGTPGATGASSTWGITGSIAITDQGTTSDAETSGSSAQITRTDSNN
jgi:hypothetical protein